MMLSLVVVFICLKLLLVTGIQNDSASHLGWTPSLTHIMQIPSNRNFSIVVFLPIHQRGTTVFDCGTVSKGDLLSQLITVNYAVNVTNEEAILRTGITLGAYIIDDCSQPLRAVQTLYQLLAGNEKVSNDSIVNPRSVVAVITTEAAVSKAIDEFLSSFQIPLISAFLKPEWEPFSTYPRGIHLIADSAQWLDAVVSFLKESKVEFISLIVVNSYGRNSRDYLLDKLKNDVCIVSDYELAAENEFKSLARTIVSNSEGHPILFLSDDHHLTINFLTAYTTIAPESNHVFIVSDQLLSRKSIYVLNTNILLVGLIPERQYGDLEMHVEKVSPHSHSPINDEWFEQLWQQRFHCSLSPTHSRPLCTGHERMDDNFTFSSSADYVSLAIKIASVGFQNFLTRHCQQHDQISNIDDCGSEARSFLLTETRKAWRGDKQRGQRPLVASAEHGIAFQLYSRDGELLENGLTKIAEWNNGTLVFDESPQSTLKKLHLVEFSCTNKCAFSCPEKAARIMASNLELDSNFRTTWGLVTSSLSALGMFVVLGCAAYLIVVVPSSRGTMVLNYVILFGIFVLFGSNFAFITLANKIICTARRLVMGVAYAIIFSAKLMKVLSIWRMSQNRSSSSVTSCIMIHQNQDDAKPSFILFVSLAIAFFQAGIATAWIILSPPDVVYVTLQPLCSPGLMFEEGLVLSLFYVMVLMVVTFVLATVTWKYESNHRESRWIFASTVLVCFIWLLWTLTATQSDVDSRNMAIVIGNLLCATVIFTCLFVPKLYLYSKLLKQAKKLDIRAFYPHSLRSQQNVPSLYDPLQHGSVNSSYSSITGTLTTVANSDRKVKKSLSFDKHHPTPARKHDGFPRPVYDGRSQFSVEQRSPYFPPRLNAIHDLPPTRAMQNHVGADYF